MLRELNDASLQVGLRVYMFKMKVRSRVPVGSVSAVMVGNEPLELVTHYVYLDNMFYLLTRSIRINNKPGEYSSSGKHLVNS